MTSHFHYFDCVQSNAKCICFSLELISKQISIVIFVTKKRTKIHDSMLHRRSLHNSHTLQCAQCIRTQGDSMVSLGNFPHTHIATAIFRHNNMWVFFGRKKCKRENGQEPVRRSERGNENKKKKKNCRPASSTCRTKFVRNPKSPKKEKRNLMLYARNGPKEEDDASVSIQLQQSR